MLKKHKNTIERLFSAKKQRRADLAGLPIEEKIKILVQLQKIASAILSSRGIKKRPWRW